jgi:uncharacterized protein (DUF433 family)
MYDGESEDPVRDKQPLDELYAGEAVITVPLYSIGEAARYLRVAETTVRSWIDGRTYPVKKSGKARSNQIIIPAAATGSGSRLSFLNLVEIHILDALRRQYRLQLPDIRHAVFYLRDHFGSQNPLARRDMLTDGRHLFVEAIGSSGASTLVNASREGQLALRDLVELHLRRVDWDPQGLVARLYPFVGQRTPTPDVPRVIAIDPRLSFGRPVVARLGVPTNIIADRFDAGESIDDLVDDYGAEPVEIQEALRCEFQVSRAA